MKSKIDLGFRSLLLLSLTAILASCNLYSKFGSTGSDEGKIEQALHCLHDSDYACAIENYTALADTTERARRLCQVNLARAGLTLNVLINTLGTGSSTAGADVLGKVANAIIPWSDEKQAAILAAAAPCDAYFATDKTSQYGKVLLTLSGIMSCAVVMAKTDQFVASSDADTVCTTPGNGDGKVGASDISDKANGTISAKGMCSADAKACASRISAVSAAAGGDQNIDKVAGQLSSLTGTSTSDAIRGLLRTRVAN